VPYCKKIREKMYQYGNWASQQFNTGSALLKKTISRPLPNLGLVEANSALFSFCFDALADEQDGRRRSKFPGTSQRSADF